MSSSRNASTNGSMTCAPNSRSACWTSSTARGNSERRYIVGPVSAPIAFKPFLASARTLGSGSCRLVSRFSIFSMCALLALLCQLPQLLHQCQRQAKGKRKINEEERMIHEAVGEHVRDGGHEADAEGEEMAPVPGPSPVGHIPDRGRVSHLQSPVGANRRAPEGEVNPQAGGEAEQAEAAQVVERNVVRVREVGVLPGLGQDVAA